MDIVVTEYPVAQDNTVIFTGGIAFKRHTRIGTDGWGYIQSTHRHATWEVERNRSFRQQS